MGVTNSQIARCLVSANASGLEGGGLYCLGSVGGVTSSIVNSTFTGNTTNVSGGGDTK